MRARTATIGSVAEFVPTDFEVPLVLETPEFVLEPLGPEHNEQDYDAWTSSMEHIARTPGYPDGSWPREMTPDENRADLQRHADDFRNRKGFTYTVLEPGSRDVIGCVYIYPRPSTQCPTGTTTPVHSHGCARAARTWTLHFGAPCVSGSLPTGHSTASSTRRAPRPRTQLLVYSGCAH